MNFSSLGLIEVLALGALGFAVFYGVRFALNLVIDDAVTRTRTRRIMTVVEAVLAVLFLFFSVFEIFQDNDVFSPIAGLVAFVLICAAAWFLLRDVTAGFVIRAGDTLRPGDRFEAERVKGTVHRLGYRVLVLENESGEEVFVPYSAVQSAIVTRVPRSFGAFGHKFTLKLPAHISATDGARTIKRAALLSHWHSPVKDVQLDPTSDGDVVVRVFALHPLYGAEIEAAVRAAVDKLAA